MTYDWSKMVKMTVPVGLCGWQQRGSLTINGRTTEFPVGVETELPEPVAERVKALMADAEEKAEHVQPLKPWMQYVTGADGVARWEPRLAYAETEEVVIVPETTFEATEETEGIAVITETPLYMPIEGGTYEVNWNGTSYSTVCVVMESGTEGKLYLLGNLSAESGPDTGEPFSIGIYDDIAAAEFGIRGMIAPLDGSTTITMSITGEVEKVKTIDPDKMGKNAGANKVLVTDENGEAVWSDGLQGGSVTVILKETTLEYKGTGTDGYASHELHTPLAARLSAGMVCDVMYNGKAYSSTAKTVAGGELLAVGLGNIDAALGGGTGTGEPFCIIQPPEELAASLGYLLVTDFDGAESVTLSITAKTAGGDSGGGILYVTARLDDSAEQPAITHASHTYEEIDAAVTAGKFCVLKLDAAGGTGAMVFFVPLLSKENIDGEVYKFTLAMNGGQINIGVTRAGWLMMTA